jgi:hypothetical protein
MPELLEFGPYYAPGSSVTEKWPFAVSRTQRVRI